MEDGTEYDDSAEDDYDGYDDPAKDTDDNMMKTTIFGIFVIIAIGLALVTFLKFQPFDDFQDTFGVKILAGGPGDITPGAGGIEFETGYGDGDLPNVVRRHVSVNGRIITVNLAIDVSEGTRYFIIDEIPPKETKITSIGSLVLDAYRHLKIVIVGAEPKRYEYTYTLEAPSSGVYMFNGESSVENVGEAEISGDNTAVVEVVNTDEKGKQQTSYDNFIIQADAETRCEWKPDNIDDGYKICSVIIDLNNSRTTDVSFRLDPSQFAIESKDIKNGYVKYEVAGKRIVTDKSYYADITNGTKPDLINVTKITYDGWRDLNMSPSSMNSGGIMAIRATFELPKYGAYKYNFTMKELGYKLDPDVSACGTLAVAGGVYTQTANFSTTTNPCIQFSADNIVYEGNNNFITDTGSAEPNWGSVRIVSRLNITIRNLKLNYTGAGNYIPLRIVNSNFTNVYNTTMTSRYVVVYLEGVIFASNFSDVYGNMTAVNGVFWATGNTSFTNITRSIVFAAQNGIGFYFGVNTARWNNITDNFINATTHMTYAAILYNNSFNNSVVGNYWGRPAHTGFSDNCTDAGGDGICDSPYIINSGAFDFKPKTYTTNYVPPILYPFIWMFSPNTTHNNLNTSTFNLLYMNSTARTVAYNYTSGNVTLIANTTVATTDGSYYIQLWANNSFGNYNFTVPFTLNVDTQPPNTTIDNASSVTLGSPVSIQLQGTCIDNGIAGLNAAYTNSTYFAGIDFSPAIWNLTNTSSLPMTTTSVYVICNDSYGNNINFSKITIQTQFACNYTGAGNWFVDHYCEYWMPNYNLTNANLTLMDGGAMACNITKCNLNFTRTTKPVWLMFQYVDVFETKILGNWTMNVR